jgi:hypothetical protein
LSAFALNGHTRLLRFAIFLVAVWQVGAPLTPHRGTFSGATSTRPHWHATGDSLELGHDETACPGCTIQQTSRATTQAARFPLNAAGAFRFVTGTVDRPVAAFGSVYLFSRAPPSLG